LLGKGWTEVAELVGMSADDIRKQLAAVGDEKVFDAAQVKQARDYRAAMDTLNDALQKVVLVIGRELGPSIAKAAEQFGQLVDDATPAIEALLKLKETADKIDFLGLAKGPVGLAQSLRELATTGDIVDVTKLSLEELNDLIGKASPEAAAIAIRQWHEANVSVADLKDGADQSARYLGLLAQHTRESADAATDLSGGARLAREQLKLLQDQIEGRKSFINLAQQLRDNATKIADLRTEYESGKISAEDYYLGVADAALESQGAVADYASELDSISEDRKIELLASFDPTAPAATINAFQAYAETHAIQLRFQTDRETRRLFAGITGRGDVGYERNANGGRSRGGLTLVGEYGPEMVNLPAGAMVSTAAQTRQMLSGGGGITVVVNAPVGANMIEAGRQVADALNDYYRSGGQRVA
jgi:hypothetical protein